jgi:hypothetical protein
MMKQGTQLDTPAGRYAIRALREGNPSIEVIVDLEETYGLTPRDAASLVDAAEDVLVQETGERE